MVWLLCKTSENIDSHGISCVSCDDRTCPSSHTTYACLNDEEKNERMRRMQKKMRMGQQQIRRLQEALA